MKPRMFGACGLMKLGLGLPALVCLACAAGCQSAASTQRWEARKHQPSDPPQIRFAFDQPHDSYQGTAAISQGVLQLGHGGAFEKATGQFDVSIDGISLGEAELDESVRYGAVLLQGRKHPWTRFTIREIRGETSRLTKDQAVVLVGDFELKGVSIPLSISARLQRQQSIEGTDRLMLWGEFKLEQLNERFGITGPGEEGDPSGNFVRVAFHAYLLPVDHPPEAR